MLAERLPGILPRMSCEEALEVTRVYSVAGLLGEIPGLMTMRPFRVPHHHISLAGLIGGGIGLARPGEISLAHRGVLFLDEIALYKSPILDSLRAPLEEGVVRLARSGGTVAFPCRFSLLGAMNPCPCGFRDDGSRKCQCPARLLNHYDSKLSGPLLDRFDMQVVMTRLSKSALVEEASGASSAEIRRRVEAARKLQEERYGLPGVTNGSAPTSQLEPSLVVTSSGQALLEHAIDELGLSGRGFNRVLRVLRTIGDLAQMDVLDDEQVAEALGLRLRDKYVGVAA